jgi:hypothetical protein
MRRRRTMRPGYDRVRSDTRRPPIPDLPLPDEPDAQSQDVANDVGKAIFVLSAVFVVMLVFALVTTVYASRTSRQPATTTHLTVPAI